jgi:hypothetical protein
MGATDASTTNTHLVYLTRNPIQSITKFSQERPGVSQGRVRQPPRYGHGASINSDRVRGISSAPL